MRKASLLFLLGILFTESLYSQYNFSLSQATEDFDYYINTLKTKHPNLYAFVSEKDFNKEVEQARSMLTDSIHFVDFWKILLSLQHCLDGHSGVEYIDVKSSFPELFKNLKEPPSFLYPDSITENAIYMNGRRVLSINGMKSQEIILRLRKCINTEENQKLMWCNLIGRFPSLSYYVLNITPPYSVVYQGVNGKEIMKTEIGVSDPRIDYGKVFSNNFFDYKLYPEESIAYLEVNTFSLTELAGGSIDSLRTSLDTFFEEKKINDYKYLFIDISRNTGGGDVPVLALFDKLQHDSVAIVNKATREIYSYPRVAKGYSGPVFVIAGHWTYSAAHLFYQLMKVSHTGIFVGEPPGHIRMSFAPLIRFKLPNTNLPFNCAKRPHEFDIDTTPDIPWSIDCFRESFGLDELKKMIELYDQKK